MVHTNHAPLYVHHESNHPPKILKNIPESINKRLSTISSNETIFNEAAPDYQTALNNSGYDYKLKYCPNRNDTNDTNKGRKRHRNVSWFNPPFSTNVATNVGKKFLSLLDKCFPCDHPLHKILNRNTIKVSYSCMPNMQQIISNHNKATLNKAEPENKTQKNCNCRAKECPLDKNCQTSEVIYQATVTSKDTTETYVGLTSNTFKIRYNGHTSDFQNSNKRHATTLSSHVWLLKDSNSTFNIKWKILAKSRAYSTVSKVCNLCIKEKYFIICHPEMASLNHRNELGSECRHRKKHLLANAKWTPNAPKPK